LISSSKLSLAVLQQRAGRAPPLQMLSFCEDLKHCWRKENPRLLFLQRMSTKPDGF
jgi:hypothetical protein